MPVQVQGPDGNTYQFPDGTDKAAAIGYFKKKGIGSKSAAEPKPALPGGVGRFLSSAGSAITSVPKAIYHAAADAPRNPSEAKLAENVSGALTLKRMLVDPQVDQGKEAMDPTKSVPERVGHGLAAVLPAVGPWAAQVGEQVGKQAGSGDYAGAAGTLAGNAALYAAPKALGKFKEISPEGKVNKLTFASKGDAETIKSTLPSVEKAAEKTGARKTVGDYLQNINTAKSDLNTEYANAIGPYSGHQTMPSAISQKILALETPNMAKTAAGRAEAAAIRKAASEFQQPWTLGELDAERMSANARLSAYENKSIADQYSTLRKSRSVAIDKAIADGVRETVYPQMDQLTGKPSGYFASLKQQIGSLLELQSRVSRTTEDLRNRTAEIKGAPRLKKAAVAEGAGAAASGYKHGVIRTLARAAVPENPEKVANKRVAQALRPAGGRSAAFPAAAVAGEQEDEDKEK